MASEGRLRNLAKGMYLAEHTVECLESIIAIASLFGKLAFSYISVREMEVQV